MTLALAVEIALTVLLAATLIYCAILERRLAALRKGQDGFKDTIAELNTAIAAAGTSMRLLKSSAAGAVESLDERLSRARNLIDELDLLSSSGERIAQRIEKCAASERAASGTPAVLANRLDALRRPDAPRAASMGAAAMGHVR
jgi:phage shock protein A